MITNNACLSVVFSLRPDAPWGWQGTLPIVAPQGPDHWGLGKESCEWHPGPKSFCPEVTSIASPHMSLVNASHMDVLSFRKPAGSTILPSIPKSIYPSPNYLVNDTNVHHTHQQKLY